MLHRFVLNSVGKRRVHCISFSGSHASSKETNRKAADQFPIFNIHPIAELRDINLDALHKFQICSNWTIGDDAGRYLCAEIQIRDPQMFDIVTLDKGDLQQERALIRAWMGKRIHELTNRLTRLIDSRSHPWIIRSY